MKKVIIDLSECDIEEFEGVVYKNRSFSWVFPTTDGEDIEIEFVQYNEEPSSNIEPYDEEFDR